MDRRVAGIYLVASVLAGCAGPQSQHDPALDQVTVTPDRPHNPRSIRFEVPTALVMDLPGAHVPNTLQARISTRAIAARELLAAGYCERGFTGPDELLFLRGDRSRMAFIVTCIA